MSTTALAVPRQRMGLLAVGTLAGVLVASLAGIAAQPAHAQDTSTDQVHTISVSGTGTIKAKPDVADVSLGVSIQRDRAGDASAEAADAMAKVIESLLANGIAEDDIQTTQLSLDPVYNYNRDPAVIVGYNATNIVSVTVRDLAKLGSIVDAAVDAGATNIGGISFRVDDSAALTVQARDAAMADAKAVADQLAAAAGVRITGVVSIVENVSQPPMPIYYAAEDSMAGARAATTPVLAGNVDVEVQVAVVYSIE